MKRASIAHERHRRPALFAAAAMLTMVAITLAFGWSLLDPDGSIQSMKLNHAIMDEATAAPVVAAPD